MFTNKKMFTVENVMLSIDQVSTLLKSGLEGQYTDSILNMCQHLKVIVFNYKI